MSIYGATHTFVGFCKCGKWIYFAVDIPDSSADEQADSLQERNEIIRSGGTIKYVTIEEGKELLRGEICSCGSHV